LFSSLVDLYCSGYFLSWRTERLWFAVAFFSPREQPSFFFLSFFDGLLFFFLFLALFARSPWIYRQRPAV